MPLPAENILKAIKEMREKTKKRNFLQSVELIINLRDIDMRRPEERVQEWVELPNPPNKEVKICFFATGDMALRAKEAGVDVLGEDEIKALAGNKVEQKRLANKYDYFLAEAPLMPLVGKVLGSVLAPRGKMPAPVPPSADVAKEIERRRRMVLLRTRRAPIIQCRVGTEDMSDEQLVENIQAVIGRLEAKLKKGLKNIASIYVKETMGPAVKVNL
ncbi:MAG TPA: 50S ribosomal protein L1 [Candidatus Bathyarchaeota archaeon]|nr:MAG: 50S ribosomal protein L1 [Candidatus Bathyarchaeota archaeon]HDM27110.1 50S ribosomal protein L1 [Candidatus Bathyarchaeota archaeon]